MTLTGEQEVRPMSPFSVVRAFMEAAARFPLPSFGGMKAEKHCAKIIQEVARKYYQRPSDLTGRRRWPEIMVARQEAYWRCRQEVKGIYGRPLSYPRIGEAFGRDHSTIISGIAAHLKRMGKENAGTCD